MLQDISVPSATLKDLLNLSPADFTLAKIKERMSEIQDLKEQYFKLTGQDADAVINGYHATNVIYPSKKELEANIASFLDDKHDRCFKTSDLIKRFHPTITDSKIRLEYTRRYSGVLSAMKKDGNMYSKEIKGEKGDMYCANKQILELM